MRLGKFHGKLASVDTRKWQSSQVSLGILGTHPPSWSQPLLTLLGSRFSAPPAVGTVWFCNYPHLEDACYLQIVTT